jgi:hypothetical protein
MKRVRAGKVMSHRPKLEVPVSPTMASSGRRKDSIEGQRKDWVRWVALSSRGVRGGGRMGLGMVWVGVEGRAVVRAARRDLMDVLG